MDAPGRYLDVLAASAYTGLSISFLQKLSARRRVPIIRVGRRVLYDRQQLDKWMSRRQVLPRDWSTGDGA